MTNNGNNCAVFALRLDKKENTLSEFVAVDNSGCTIGDLLGELQVIGLCFPNNFGVHLGKFIDNCINTFVTLDE